ncbi:hypothetical protein I3W98_26130, partial [Streptomyces cavourensis]|nr:hypothetical protein [Streptomyces cavourensis]
MAGTDREKALDAALAQIERQFGKGAVMRLGERPNEPVEVIPTGSTALASRLERLSPAELHTLQATW